MESGSYFFYPKVMSSTLSRTNLIFFIKKNKYKLKILLYDILCYIIIINLYLLMCNF